MGTRVFTITAGPPYYVAERTAGKEQEIGGYRTRELAVAAIDDELEDGECAHIQYVHYGE